MKARRWWAWPLVPVYAAGLAVKDALRRVGVLRVRRLEWPVVSVGSLSAGGAGKTPVVIALVQLLQREGWGVDVLSRGYGRGGDGVERVNLEVGDAAQRFGDEPVVIARRTGAEVWVGPDRFRAGAESERFGPGKAGSSAPLRQSQEQDKSEREEDSQAQRRGTRRPPGVHVLDDGFQHRRLSRKMDVVLVTAADLDDALLPAGNRREPLRALRRADVVVLREEERDRIEGRVRRWMPEGALVWVARRRLRLGGEKAATGLGGVVAFCGIARPEGLWRMLEATGCEVLERVAFGDHHPYDRTDVERLVKTAEACGARRFITTEKDAVKLTATMLARLEEVGPVDVAGLDVTLLNETSVLRDMEDRLG